MVLMIRKITNIILVLVLLVPTTGITYHYHYCCNTLIKFSVLHTPEACCEHPEECCRDEAVTLQMKNDFVFSPDLPDLSQSCIEVPALFTLPEEIRFLEMILPAEPVESPPPDVGSRLSQLSQYRI